MTSRGDTSRSPSGIKVNPGAELTMPGTFTSPFYLSRASQRGPRRGEKVQPWRGLTRPYARKEEQVAVRDSFAATGEELGHGSFVADRPILEDVGEQDLGVLAHGQVRENAAILRHVVAEFVQAPIALKRSVTERHGQQPQGGRRPRGCIGTTSGAPAPVTSRTSLASSPAPFGTRRVSSTVTLLVQLADAASVGG